MHLSELKVMNSYLIHPLLKFFINGAFLMISMSSSSLLSRMRKEFIS
jgi:hypothetical protein